MSKHILLLRGIYIDKLIPSKTTIEHKEQPIIIKEEKETTLYDKIPTKYVKGQWIKKTNIKCWKCDRKFKGIPYFVATKSLEDPTGNFCSPGCAKAYIIRDVHGPHKWEMEMQLYNLYHDLHGHQASFINAAPDKILRIEYGGSMTDEEFEIQVNNCVKMS
jgi:hypothetical protein